MLDETDRERLKAMRAWVRWEDGKSDGFTDEQSEVCKEHARDRLGLAYAHTSYDDLLLWGRAEIARLEALDRAEADAFSFRPLPEMESRLAAWAEEANGVDVTFSATELDELVKPDHHRWQWPIVPYTNYAVGKDAKWVSVVMEAKPAEQSLDAFMREREAKQEAADLKAYKAEVWPTEPSQEHPHNAMQPASRELVERMVREATAHSKWPVEMTWGRGSIALDVLIPKTGHGVEFDAGDMSKMSEILSGVAMCRAAVDDSNAKACPTCNGKGKTRGEIMWGEQDCGTCHGSGVQ
jgi:hypothetical protein